MNETPSYLQQNKKLVDELDHQNVLPFLQPYIKADNPWTISYWFFNIAGWGYLFFHLFAQRQLPIMQYVDQISLGFALFFFPLLPIHELIHGLVYKYFGAPKVSYKADLKKLIFYAMADNYVVNGKELTAIAIAPFLVINVLLLSLFFVLPERQCWLPYGAMLVHIGGCYGDFALISYFYKNRHRNIVTYDSLADKKSYFYEL